MDPRTRPYVLAKTTTLLLDKPLRILATRCTNYANSNTPPQLKRELNYSPNHTLLLTLLLANTEILNNDQRSPYYTTTPSLELQQEEVSRPISRPEHK